MKSLEDLRKLRENAKKKMTMRLGSDQKYRVVVGMATCGIAAGARPVLNTMVEEINTRELSAAVTQTGCIGMCSLEPIVEIFDQAGNKTTYVLMNPDKAKEVIESHIVNDKVLTDYTIGAAEK